MLGYLAIMLVLPITALLQKVRPACCSLRCAQRMPPPARTCDLEQSSSRPCQHPSPTWPCSRRRGIAGLRVSRQR
jgi:hypothetical protein